MPLSFCSIPKLGPWMDSYCTVTYRCIERRPTELQLVARRGLFLPTHTRAVCRPTHLTKSVRRGARPVSARREKTLRGRTFCAAPSNIFSGIMPGLSLESRMLPPRNVEHLPGVYLAPQWQRRGIHPQDIDNAEYWARNASKWDVAGSWRARVINGSLYLRMLSMQPHWAERTSVLRLVLLALRRAAIRREVHLLEGVDMVYVHNDRDPTPWRGYPPGNKIPLMTNAHAAGLSSIPLPEFSWAGWHTHTAPWCRLSAEVAAAGMATTWDNRTDIAFFSGGLENGPMRHQLRRLVATEAAQGVIKVRNVAPRFYTTTAAAKAGRDQSQPMSAMCGYKFLISVAGYGYSNRLKSLLLCGSVVVHVKQPWNEFFFPMLRNGTNIAVAHSVADIIPTVQRLRANATLARQIAANGRRLALRQLGMDRTLDYLTGLLKSYSSIQRQRATDTYGYTRSDTTSALGRVAAQCECGVGVTRPTPERCGVSRLEFTRGIRAGKHRCCEGWDCPVEICEALVSPRLNGGGGGGGVGRMARGARGASAGGGKAGPGDSQGGGSDSSSGVVRKAERAAEAAGGVYVPQHEWKRLQRLAGIALSSRKNNSTSKGGKGGGGGSAGAGTSSRAAKRQSNRGKAGLD